MIINLMFDYKFTQNNHEIDHRLSFYLDTVFQFIYNFDLNFNDSVF